MPRKFRRHLGGIFRHEHHVGLFACPSGRIPDHNSQEENLVLLFSDSANRAGSNVIMVRSVK